MKIEIQDLQTLISQQKQLVGVSMYGVFADGYLAALDIVNSYLKLKEPKCSDCRIELSESEIDEGHGVCDRCYNRAQSEAQAERNREESGT